MGHLKNINISFETNGKLMALGVPILKHFRVFSVRVYPIRKGGNNENGRVASPECPFLYLIAF